MPALTNWREDRQFQREPLRKTAQSSSSAETWRMSDIGQRMDDRAEKRRKERGVRQRRRVVRSSVPFF